MNVHLNNKEYESISTIVREKLQQLMPDNVFVKNEALVFGPEFLAQPLRIDTPKTKIEFDDQKKFFVKTLRDEIDQADLPPSEKRQKNQQLESIILFGQILFSQSACLHFLKNPLEKKETTDEDINDDPERLSQLIAIETNFKLLRQLAEQEGVNHDSSRLEALTRRKQFNDLVHNTKHLIKNSDLENDEKHQFYYNLSKAKDFYSQANDFNFRYANKPSRSFSNFINTLEKYGTKIALAASIIAIGATALSLIPPLAPIMAPIALVSSSISMAIGLPLALKNLGTMIYNLIRFGAAPTPAELINTALLGTSLLLSGVGGVVAQAVNAGQLAQVANITTKALTSANDLTKATLGVTGQVMGEQTENSVNHYRSQLKIMKSALPVIAESVVSSEDDDTNEFTGDNPSFRF